MAKMVECGEVGKKTADLTLTRLVSDKKKAVTYVTAPKISSPIFLPFTVMVSLRN